MESEDRIELYTRRLSREFNLSEDYEGRHYTMVAEKSGENAKALGKSELVKTVLLVSKVPENGSDDFVQSEIEKIRGVSCDHAGTFQKTKLRFLQGCF